MKEIVFGELPEIIIKVKGQLQHVGLDATAEVIAGALGEKGSSSYHVGQCAKWLISEIERELGLGQAAAQGRRQRGLSRKMTMSGMGGSNLLNRLKQSKASQVDMASLAVSINILFKMMAFELTAFLQVNSEIASSMPDLTWPKAFGDISSAVSSVVNLDFVTEHGDADCTLGNNYCFRVMMMMLGILGFQLAFPACVALIKYSPLRKCVTQERLNQLVDRCYHGNAVVMMILHPTISKKLASILACRYYNGTRVVQAAKTISCGDNTCLITGVFFFVLYTVGIPVYVWYSLRAGMVKTTPSAVPKSGSCASSWRAPGGSGRPKPFRLTEPGYWVPTPTGLGRIQQSPKS